MAGEVTNAAPPSEPVHPLFDRSGEPFAPGVPRRSAYSSTPPPREGSSPGTQAILAVAAGALLLLALPGAAATEGRPIPETYTATTADMTPAGTTLKIEVMEWSGDDARANAVSALTSTDDLKSALAALPTVGYLWRSGSGVGYSIKYAHRETTPNSGERVTVVTDKPLGAYSFKPWVVEKTSAKNRYDYSVIELELDQNGHGSGTTSLAADVTFDKAAHTISLQRDPATPSVLKDAKHEPKPYWAK